MKRILGLLVALILFLLLGGCGSGDTAPPRILSVFPPDGYHGFKHGEAISFEFSEPVDLDSFMQAYHSTSDGLEPEQVSLRLADGGRKITLYPSHDLDYSPDASYRYYGFEISTELRDRAGNHLAEPLRVTFTTMRRVTAELVGEAALDGTVLAGQQAVADQNVFLAGDNVNDAPLRGFVSFAAPAAADGFLAGTLQLTVATVTGLPVHGLGDLNLEWLDYGGALDPSDFNLPALSASPILDGGSGWQADNPVRYDVSDWVRAAWQGGRSHLQFRLRFASDSDQDGSSDAVWFYSADAPQAAYRPLLELTYYGP